MTGRNRINTLQVKINESVGQCGTLEGPLPLEVGVCSFLCYELASALCILFQRKRKKRKMNETLELNNFMS